MFVDIKLKEVDKRAMGARIRALREDLKISREELSERLSVTPKFVADIEYGEKGISLRTLYKLKQLLNVSADFLLAGNESDLHSDEQIKMLHECIINSLNACSAEQLSDMAQIARLYAAAATNNNTVNNRETK